MYMYICFDGFMCVTLSVNAFTNSPGPKILLPLTAHHQQRQRKGNSSCVLPECCLVLPAAGKQMREIETQESDMKKEISQFL